MDLAATSCTMLFGKWLMFWSTMALQTFGKDSDQSIDSDQEEDHSTDSIWVSDTDDSDSEASDSEACLPEILSDNDEWCRPNNGSTIHLQTRALSMMIVGNSLLRKEYTYRERRNEN